MSDPTTTPPTMLAIPTLKHVPSDKRPYKQWPTFWHRPDTWELLQSQPTNGMVDLAAYGDGLAGVLIHVSQWCHANGHKQAIVYLTGGHDAASTQPAEWYRAPLLAKDNAWRITSWRTGPMAVTYEALGITVHVRVAAAWFDETDASLIDLAGSYSGLGEFLYQDFGPGGHVLGTPAQTGLNLLEIALPFEQPLPILPAELREMIQHNSPQGRNEVFTADDGPNAGIGTLDGLVCYDAKWMYASCLNHVPAGRYEHHTYGDHHVAWANFSEWVVGFYRFTAEVPRDWCHIGLLPKWDTQRADPKTVYPWEPGTLFEGWATGAELQLAQKKGWRCWIQEALVWPDAMKLNPLRNWRDKLIPQRAWAEEHGLDLIATAQRHIVIDALGALARRDTREHHVTPYAQMKTIPHDAYNRDLQQWGIEWDVDVPMSGWMMRFQHPEIPAMVWGKARTRLATFMLSLPVYANVLARTDAAWVQVSDEFTQLMLDKWRVPADKLKPGDWRMKEQLAGPLAAPVDTGEALQLMRRARGKAGA